MRKKDPDRQTDRETDEETMRHRQKDKQPGQRRGQKGVQKDENIKRNTAERRKKIIMERRASGRPDGVAAWQCGDAS